MNFRHFFSGLATEAEIAALARAEAELGASPSARNSAGRELRLKRLENFKRSAADLIEQLLALALCRVDAEVEAHRARETEWARIYGVRYEPSATAGAIGRLALSVRAASQRVASLKASTTDSVPPFAELLFPLGVSSIDAAGCAAILPARSP